MPPRSRSGWRSRRRDERLLHPHVFVGADRGLLVVGCPRHTPAPRWCAMSSRRTSGHSRCAEGRISTCRRSAFNALDHESRWVGDSCVKSSESSEHLLPWISSRLGRARLRPGVHGWRRPESLSTSAGSPTRSSCYVTREDVIAELVAAVPSHRPVFDRVTSPSSINFFCTRRRRAPSSPSRGTGSSAGSSLGRRSPTPINGFPSSADSRVSGRGRMRRRRARERTEGGDRRVRLAADDRRWDAGPGGP